VGPARRRPRGVRRADRGGGGTLTRARTDTAAKSGRTDAAAKPGRTDAAAAKPDRTAAAEPAGAEEGSRAKPAGSDRLTLAPGVRLRWDRRACEYVLLSPERGLRLNATAALVLSLCDGTRSVDQLLGELGARFPDEPEGRVAREAFELIADLAVRGLVRAKAAT
jgi:pyrroloquinoline quinone biosynthesis protein D